MNILGFSENKIKLKEFLDKNLKNNFNLTFFKENKNNLREEVIKKLLKEKIDLILFYGDYFSHILELKGIKVNTILVLDSFEEKIIKNYSSDTKKQEVKDALLTLTTIYYKNPSFSLWVEDNFNIGLSSNIDFNKRINFLNKKTIISLGAGMGNVTKGLPLVKKVSQYLNSPVDVFLKCKVKEACSLFTNSSYINFVSSEESFLYNKKYDFSYITASAGAVPPPVNSKKGVSQRYFYHLYEECRDISENEYCFLGIKDLFKDFKYQKKDCSSFFIRDFELREVLPTKNLIGIFNSSSSGFWEARNFNSFNELIPQLKKRGYEVASFGLKDQYQEGTIDLTGTSLRKSIENIKKCEFFISADGGLLNIADALGVCCVGIFGPTSVIKIGIGSKTSIIVHSNLLCSPCQFNLDYVTCDNNLCIQKIRVEDILKAFDKLKNRLKENSDTEDFKIDRLNLFFHEKKRQSISCRESFSDKYFYESIKFYPKDVTFYKRLIRVNFKEKNYLKALKLINYALKEFPLNYIFYYLKAELYIKERKFNDAILAAKDGLKVDKDNYRLKKVLQQASLSSFLYDEVIKVGYEYKENNSIESDRAWYVGISYRGKRDYLKAKKAFKDSLKMNPNGRAKNSINTLNESFFRLPKDIKEREKLELFKNKKIKILVIAKNLKEIPVELKPYRDLISIFFSYENEISSIDFSSFNYILNFTSSKVKNFISLESLLKELKKIKNLTLKENLKKFSNKRIILFAEHHLSKFEPHGGEFSMKEISNRLKELGSSVLVVVSNRKNEEVFLEHYKGLDFVVAHQSRYLEVLEGVVSTFYPDLILTWGPQSLESYKIAKKYNVPYIMFVRYWKVVMEPPYEKEFMFKVKEGEVLKYKPLYDNATFSIVNGEYVKKVIKKRYNANPLISYVPVYPPPKDYIIPSYDKREYVTLVNPRKAGGENILRKIALVLSDIKFQVIGEPSIDLPKNVEIKPYFKGNYYEMLKDARVLLFFWGEVPCGTGRVVYEAYYSDVPVVSVDIGGMYEVIPKKWLVKDNNDIVSWTRIINNLYYSKKEDILSEIKELKNKIDSKEQMRIIERAVESILIEEKRWGQMS